MRRLVGRVAGAALAAATLAVASSPAATGRQGSIDGAVAEMRAALQRGDARALASFYTEDADLAGPVSVKGRAAIERHMADTIALGIRDVKLEQQETFLGADYVTQTGRASFFDKAGTRVTVLGYMTLWRRDGDAWRIHRDVSIPVALDTEAVARMVAAGGGFSVKETAPFHALVLPMTGSYQQHGEAIARLALWLDKAGVRPAGPPFGRYLNSAEDVPEASLEWEVGFPVPAGTEAAAPFEARKIADGIVATAVIGGPRDGKVRPWPQLIDWVEKRGYQVAGPAMEIWPGEENTEMRLAVRR